MISYEYIDIKLVIILLLIIGLINDIITWSNLEGFFLFLGFLLQVLTIHRTIGERRGTSSLLPYQFHPLTAIHTFICSLATEMSSLHFYSLWRNYQCATQFIPRWKLKLGSIIIAFYLAFFKVKSCPSNFSQKRDCFEFTSIITPVFQAKCMT